jgi:hypothetical protein
LICVPGIAGDVGTNWALGPELLLGELHKWGAVGGVISHQWDFAGYGTAEIDLTAINYFICNIPKELLADCRQSVYDL